MQIVITPVSETKTSDKVTYFTSSNEEALMRLLYVNGMNSTTNIDSDVVESEIKVEEIGSV